MICGIRTWFIVVGLGLVLAGVQLVAFDPGTGPGSIDATDKIAYVSEIYQFADGDYARGMVYFAKGFQIAPGATVTFGIIPPIQNIVFPCFHSTSTVILEQPLRFGPDIFGTPILYGTFISSDPNKDVVIISEGTTINLQPNSGDANAYFPGRTTLDLGGGTLSIYTGSTIFFGSGSTPYTTLTIKNAIIAAQQDMKPIQCLSVDPLTPYSALEFNNCSFDVYKQITFGNSILAFDNNCKIRNAASQSAGAAKAKFIVENTVTGLNSYIGFRGPAFLEIGPDVDMVIGNLGKRSEYQYSPEFTYISPYGSFVAGYGGDFDCQMLLSDASITFSRPCTVEGGMRLLIQGSCDISSTATAPSDQVLSFGKTYPFGAITMDSALDIQPSSVLNVHNMVLRNNNNP